MDLTDARKPSPYTDVDTWYAIEVLGEVRHIEKYKAGCQRILKIYPQVTSLKIHTIQASDVGTLLQTLAVEKAE